MPPPLAFAYFQRYFSFHGFFGVVFQFRPLRGKTFQLFVWKKKKMKNIGATSFESCTDADDVCADLKVVSCAALKGDNFENCTDAVDNYQTVRGHLLIVVEFSANLQFAKSGLQGLEHWRKSFNSLSRDLSGPSPFVRIFI